MTGITSVFERQFHEPHEWWDLYDARREAEYQALIAGKSCLDCQNCLECERHDDTGYCTLDGEFVYDTYKVEDIGCEHFEAA